MKGGRRLLIVLGFLILAVVILIMSRSRNLPGVIDGYATTKLTSGGKSYTVLLADDTYKSTKGLGYRDNLPANQGMLFPYKVEEQQCFWMKGMKFSIDMIWLDADRKVTAVETNVSPATYPKSFCHDGQYVLELNAGQAEKAAIRQGVQLEF